MLLSVRPVTFPVVSGIIEVSVLRHLHSDASLLDRSINGDPRVGNGDSRVRKW